VRVTEQREQCGKIEYGLKAHAEAKVEPVEEVEGAVGRLAAPVYQVAVEQLVAGKEAAYPAVGRPNSQVAGQQNNAAGEHDVVVDNVRKAEEDVQKRHDREYDRAREPEALGVYQETEQHGYESAGGGRERAD